jgi:hypothetical protein
MIMEPKEEEYVDHIDGNTLNNQRSNLRIVNRFQNGMNQGKHKNNTSGYKGVNSNGFNYMARIRVNGERIYIGTYSTVEEAGRAYDNKAKELHGEFAKLNFPNL